MASQPQSVNPEVRAKFSQMREDVKKVTNRLGDIEAQQAEYAIALSALEKLPADRKCYRMVGHALVEHTVGEVSPAIKDRKEQLTTLAKGLGEQLDKMEGAATKYALDNGLATRAEPNKQEAAQKADSSKGPTGVLV